MTWTAHLTGDPLPWLLEADTPAVRAAALQRLCDRAERDPDVVAARSQAMRVDPIRTILDAQDDEGWWVKPGAGYAPKYTGTVWQLTFLDQLGADAEDPGVRRACEYVLAHTQAACGGFGASGTVGDDRPPPSRVIHCLNGNLVRALIGFGYWGDPRLRAATDWAAGAITGQPGHAYYRSGTSGPAFACAGNEGKPCAWGAVKELAGLARVPPRARSPVVRSAIDVGVRFLLSRDPMVADYPMPSRDTRPSGSWFKLGFPSGYVTSVLESLEVLGELGYLADDRLGAALAWLEAQQVDGRWVNRYAYNGKTVTDIEAQGRPSKWVTLRACSVLKTAWGAGGGASSEPAPSPAGPDARNLSPPGRGRDRRGAGGARPGSRTGRRSA